MPKQTNTELEVRSSEPGFAIANVRPMPLQFRQVLSDAPDGMRISTEPPAIQLTRKSIRRSIKRNAVIGQYWLNLPLKDPLTSVSRIYKTLEAMAFNYQQKNQNAFFEVYPDLVILSDEEQQIEDQGGVLTRDENGSEHLTPKPSLLTTAALRRDYRKYAKRAAHYLFQYCEAKKFQIGALANLLLLTRLNGNEVMKFIASDLRWSRINTRCNMYQRFPSPTGDEAYIFSNSKYAVGSTTYGSDIVAFPLWITDIFGTRGAHFVDHTQVLSTNLEDGSKTFGVDGFPNANTLLGNMLEVIQKYGNARGYNEKSPISYYPPKMPEVENAGRLSLSEGDDWAYHGSVNSDAGTIEIEGAFNVKDNLTGRLWHNYDYWTKYLTLAFPEMMDPNSDFYVMATRELKLCQPSSNLEDCLKAVRDLPNIDAASLAANMFYKANGAPNTATIVKFAPMLYSSDTTGSDWRDESVFKANFERYDVDDNNTSFMISQAQNWPKLSPSLFFKDKSSPIVVNATPEYGFEMVGADVGGPERYARTLTGKAAVLFDFIKHSDVGQDHKTVEFVGVTDAYAQNEMTIHDDDHTVVFEEYPTEMFTLVQNLIDNTDLYQCGFNIMISNDDPNPNLWDQYFATTEMSNMAMVKQDNLFSPGQHNVPGVENGVCPTNPVFMGYYEGPQSDSPAIAAAKANAYKHPVNPTYLASMKHCFVFAGGGIFQHPLVMFANKSSGFFVSKLSSDSVQKEKWWNSFHKAFGDNTSRLARGILEQGDWGPTDEADGVAVVPTSALRGVMGCIANKPKDAMYLRLSAFAEEFGPILPIMEEFPFANIADQVPYLGVGTPESLERPDASPYHGKVEPATRMYRIGGDKGSAPTAVPTFDFSSIYINFYDRDTTPAVFMKYFVGALKCPNVIVDPVNGTTRYSESEQITVDLQPDWKWLFTTMAKQVAQFAGLKSTNPFWDEMAAAKPSQADVSSAAAFPENNIMALPRVARKTVEQRRGFGHSHGDKRSSLKSESELATFGDKSAGGTTSSESSFEPRGGKKHKSRSRNQTGAKKRWSTSFPKSDDASASLTDSKDGVSQNPSEGKAFGMMETAKSDSSGKESLNFQRSKKGPSNALAVQL